MHFRRPAALAAALVFALALLVPAYAQSVGRDPAPIPGVAQIEQEFLTGMIPHHRSAMMMAQLALERGTHDELRELAQGIIEEQDAEIEKMSIWLRDWYGVEPPAGMQMPMDSMMEMMPMLHGRMPDMDADMAELHTRSGAEFEVAFMGAMSRHHAMAIAMAGPVLMAGHHADLFTLAADMVISQGEEIKQMDRWLQEWYGIQRPLEGPVMDMPMEMPMPMPMEMPMPMPMDMQH